MPCTRVKKKVPLEIGPAPLDLSLVVDYLIDLGLGPQAIRRIHDAWTGSLARRHELLDKIRRAGIFQGELLEQLVQMPKEPFVYQQLEDTVKRIEGLWADFRFEERRDWIMAAKESQRPEVARGLGGLRRKIQPSLRLISDTAKGSFAAHIRDQASQIGRSLRELRNEANLTLGDVARASEVLYPAMKEVQITAPHLNKTENSKSMLSPLKLMVLSQIYNMPFGLLLTRLGLDGTKKMLREVARDLILSVYDDLAEAREEKGLRNETELAGLEGHCASLENELSQVMDERDSFKRQIGFLEGEISTLRAGAGPRPGPPTGNSRPKTEQPRSRKKRASGAGKARRKLGD